MDILIQTKKISVAVCVLGEADVKTKSEVQEIYLGKHLCKTKARESRTGHGKTFRYECYLTPAKGKEEKEDLGWKGLRLQCRCKSLSQADGQSSADTAQ